MEYFLVALILLVSSMFLSVTGFGAGAIAVPLLLWVGYPLPDAVATIIVAAMISTAFSLKKSDLDFDWPLIRGVFIARALLLPVGIYGMQLAIEHYTKEEIRQAVGFLILLIICYKFARKPRLSTELRRGWGIFASALSGFVSGFCGMGGPFLVFWTMEHKLSVKKQRGFLLLTVNGTLIFQLFFMLFMMGWHLYKPALIGVLYAPVIIIGAKIGTYLSLRIPGKTYRFVVWSVLFVIALSAIAAPFFSS